MCIYFRIIGEDMKRDNGISILKKKLPLSQDIPLKHRRIKKIVLLIFKGYFIRSVILYNSIDFGNKLCEIFRSVK